MKRTCLFISLVFSTLFAFAQKSNQGIPEKIAKLPVFTVYKVSDSTAFTEKNLEKNKRTIFIYFGADCGHCMYFTRKLRDSIHLFENTQILMVSSSEFFKVRNFYEEQKLADCPIVTVGHDAKFFFPLHFDVRMFPSAYVYDKKGRYVKGFSNEISIQELIH